MTLKDTAFTGSREQIVHEEDFLPVVGRASMGLLRLREKVFSGSGTEWSRRFVSRLLKDIHGLRSVLNDYEAQENRTYSYFVELVAGIRGFATVIYILKHLKARFVGSPLRDTLPFAEEFLVERTHTLGMCGETLRRLFTELLAECDKLGISLPPAEPIGRGDAAGDRSIRKHLPHNLDEEEMGGEGEKIAQVATAFLRAVERYRMIEPRPLEGYHDLREFVLSRLDEEMARSLQGEVHAIQSRYDTYIQYTGSEGKDPDLKQLRSVISLTLHLLEVTTHLVHFYERHENDIRSVRTKEQIAEVVDKSAVLDRAVNYAFRMAGRLMGQGSGICGRLIPRYTSIREAVFRIPDDVRLHIRPAAVIAAIVNHHGTPVRMRIGENECDAGSVTDVIFLAGSNPESREVAFRGDERPLEDLRVLFEVGLYDDGHEDVKARLEYLA